MTGTALFVVFVIEDSRLQCVLALVAQEKRWRQLQHGTAPAGRSSRGTTNLSQEEKFERGKNEVRKLRQPSRVQGARGEQTARLDEWRCAENKERKRV